jgi:hydrogenase 3 maturation protease
MPPLTVVWGVGNEIMRDDAAGIRAAELVRERGLPWIRVSICGVLPENHIAPLREISPRLLLVIDAADFGEKPGEIRLLRVCDIGGSVFSSHGIPIGVLLEPFEKNTRIVIIAIQPQDTGLGEGLSQPVAKAVKSVAGAVCDGTWENFPFIHSENLSPR